MELTRRRLRASLGLAMTALAAVALSPRAAADITQVAGPCEGSSNPTVFASNRRVATTPGGRVLAIFDPHGSGQQLTWRDPGGRWRTDTRGAVSDGSFPEDAPGDRTGTIALHPRAGRAWMAWSGTEAVEYPVALRMARLTELGGAGGPRVADVTTISAAGRGRARPDVAFERGPRGRLRGVVTWLARSGGSFHVLAGWFGPDADGPIRVHHRATVFQSPDGATTPALVPTPGGMRILVADGRGTLRVLRHRAGAPLGRWTAGRARVAASGRARPSGVWVAPGRVIVSAGTPGGVRLTTLSADGDRVRATRRVPGRTTPVMTGDGAHRAWAVMMRSSDGVLVSRRFLSRSGWSRRERVEAGRASDVSGPNAARWTRGRLRVLLQGDGCPHNAKANEVLLLQRRVRRR